MKRLYWILIVFGIVLLILIVFIGIPYGLNWLILQPSRFDVVGDGTHWLSFWGGYLGAIISAIVAFAILFKQIQTNKVVNENNRLLQIRLLKQQQETVWLDDFCSVCIRLDKVLDHNTITNIRNLIFKDVGSAVDKCEEIISEYITCSGLLLMKKIDNDNISTLADKILEIIGAYSDAINDSMKIAVFILNNKGEAFSFNEFRDGVVLQGVTQETSDLLLTCPIEYQENTDLVIKLILNEIKDMYISKKNIITDTRSSEYDNSFLTLIYESIKIEKERINNIILETDNGTK